MNFNAFEFYWLLAEQQKMRGNTKLAESFYKKAMEAAKLNDRETTGPANLNLNLNLHLQPHLHSENSASGK